MQESGNRADAVNKNTDGSEDIGLMQINSSNLPALKQYGISRSDLFDRCKNAYIGNWILAQRVQRLGLTWDAVGAYNAASPAKREKYARQIFKQLMAIQQGTKP